MSELKQETGAPPLPGLMRPARDPKPAAGLAAIPDTASNRSPAVNAACWTLLAVFTVYLLAVNYSYQVADRRPPTFDDAWYLETSLYFYHRLTNGGLFDFLAAYAASFRTKAPLISVLPLPFYLLLGSRYHTAMLVNFAFLVIANTYLFLLGRRLFSPVVGLAAVIFFQTMPLTIGLSRVFMSDYGLAALVIAWVYYLVASEGLSRGRANFMLGALLGLGLLLKVLFPVYVAGPFLAALLWRKKSAEPISDQESSWLWQISARHPLPAIAIPAALLAATWYSFHLRDILRYAWDAGYGQIGEQYGAADVNHWFHYVINQGIGAYYAACLILFGLAALVAKHLRIEWKTSAALLAGWLLPPVAAIAAGSNREIRFLLPVLPAFALLLSASTTRAVRRPAAQLMLIAILAAFPLRLFAVLSSHTASPEHYRAEHPVKAGPFVFFARELGWARPPDNRGDWGQDRILEAIQAMEPAGATPRYVVLGIEHPYLNANLLRYLNAYRQYSLLFTSVGYAETSLDKAVERIYSLDAHYLVMGEGFHNFDLVEFLNRTNQDLQGLLDRNELPFRLRANVTLHGDIKAAIYEREQPWTSFAPGAQAEQPSHPLVADFAGGPRFLGYDWKRGGHNLCEISYYWTVPHRVDQDYRVNIEFRHAGSLLLVQDHFVGGGRHPFYDWKPGEVVRQTTTVYLPQTGQLEARIWLAPWNSPQRVQITDPREMIHESAIPLRP
jgi:4-amino-4-deoxy-L-arabinose transferase-like glycosyltransferase